MSPIRPLVRLAAVAALAVTIACGQGSTQPVEPLRASGGPAGDSYGIAIANTGATTLTAISILTGENVAPVQVAQLAPGQRTDELRIGVLHENPLVIATVGGRRREYHPVEGFTGFNPALEPGRYVITLRWNAETEFLETVVSPAQP
jgi:hypothetical protein